MRYNKNRTPTTLLILSALLLVLLGETQAQPPLLIAARGAFVRTIGTTPFNVPNGAALQWSTTALETNSEFFALEYAGRVRVNKPGVYLFMADSPFEGAAQMQFFKNGVGVYDTTVGQGGSGILNSYTIITIESPNTIIEWRNPSGHMNVIPPRVGATNSQAHLTILGLDNIEGSNPVPGYLDAVQENKNYHNYMDMNTIEKKGTAYISFRGTLMLDRNSLYLIAYQFTSNSESGHQLKMGSHRVLTSGRTAKDTQLTGKAIIKTYGDSMANQLNIHWDGDEVWSQTPNLGGNALVFNSVVVIKLNGMLATTLYTLNPPSGPHTLLPGEPVPLGMCNSCAQNFVTLNSDGSWKFEEDGIYLVSVVFNTEESAQYRITRSGFSGFSTDSAHLLGSEALLSGTHLMSGLSSASANSIQMETPITIEQHVGGNNETPISVVIIRIS